MSLLKKWLGVEELEEKMERRFRNLEQNLKTSWNWIDFLHELEQDNKERIKKLVKENQELKELIKERQTNITNAVPEQRVKKVIIKEKEGKEEVKKQEENEPEPESEDEVKEEEKEEIQFKNIDISGIGKKEAFILQILYQMACFDASSSITTTKIYKNLPYKITRRGLRKKLHKLEDQGVIGSIMYGNSRKWFLDMNKLSKLKQFLSIKNRRR